MFSKKKNILLSDADRSRMVALLTSIFALIYHICFLVVFYLLGVKQMFYFNIASVIIFTTTVVYVTKSPSVFIPYTVCAIEVIIHQLNAIYYLGGITAFHFFILLIGLIPFLVFDRKIAFGLVYVVICCTLFTIIVINEDKITGIYQLDKSILYNIRIVNISLSIMVIITMLILFTYIMIKIETQLENQLDNQTQKLLEQSNKIISIQKNTIISLANLVENRDSDTGDHVVRTSAYVEILAKKAKEDGYCSEILTDEYINLITKAAPMHDIGKIVIPDAILKKPGKLSPEEFEQIKRHTTEGRRIILDVLGNGENRDYVDIAADIATFHHEKWNGTGYPYHKSGTDIPLSARIMAIADVFDALVSPRCYKEPIPIEEAFQIIQDGKGEHFDPDLVESFLALQEPIEEITTIYYN